MYNSHSPRMILTSQEFLSLDNPPTLGLDPIPDSYYPPHHDQYPWKPAFPTTPQNAFGVPGMTPSELEEANLFVDSILTDGEPEEITSRNAETVLVSQNEKPPNHVETAVAISQNEKLPSNVVETVAIPQNENCKLGNQTNNNIVIATPEETVLVSKPAANKEGLPTKALNVPVKRKKAVKRPKDLPDDWEVIGKTREQGKSAGQTDTYYIQKSTGRKLRSMKIVRHFLATGCATIPKPRKVKKEGEKSCVTDDDGSKGKLPMEIEGGGNQETVERQIPAPWYFYINHQF